jgi:hypothetical protein
MATRRPKHVREPVQVYLDSPDRDLLDALVARTGLSKAELLRRGLRQLAAEQLMDKAPGWSLDVLSGLIDDAPPDLAERHDDHLARRLEKTKSDQPRSR